MPRVKTLIILFFGSLSTFAGKGFSESSIYPVHCENLNECPSWVVGLASDVGGSPENPAVLYTGVCSGALVAPDVVATNLHCLPSALTKAGQSCRDHIVFRFPQTNLETAQNVACDKILALSPPLGGDFLRPDYAFLKLASPVHRKPIAVSQKGFPDMTRITIYKVDPSPLGTEPNSGLEGIVRKIECKTVQNSIMNPYFSSPLSPLVMLSPCPIVKGNSGSGLIGDDGSLLGLVSSYGALLVPDKLKKKLKEKVERFESASGTNMSCIPWPLLGSGEATQNRDKTEACRVHTNEGTRQKLVDRLLSSEIQKSLLEINSKVNKQSEKFKLAGSQLFLWQASKAELEEGETDLGIMAKAKVRPRCLLPEARSLKAYESKLKPQLVSLSMKVSDFVLREQFDSYLRYQALVEERPLQVKARLIPRDLLLGQSIPVTLVFEDEKTIREENLHLDLCSTLSKDPF